MERAIVWMLAGGVGGMLVAVGIVIVADVPTLAAVAIGGLCALAGIALAGGWATR